MAYVTKKIQSPVRSVQYFNYFPRFFLRPYGKVEGPVLMENRQKKMSPINSEYLVRPKIAVSETAEIVETNVRKSIDMIETLNMVMVKSTLRSTEESCYALNNKNNVECTEKNVKMFFTAIARADVMLLDDLEQFGMALYITASHLRMVRAIMEDIPSYATKLTVCDGTEKQLLKAPNMKNLKVF